MRLIPLLCFLACFACSSIDLQSVRARDFAWLTGTWRGDGPDGAVRQQTFTAPADGAMLGEYRTFAGTEVLAESTMRIVSGTNGVLMIGTLEGTEPRSFALIDVGPRRARFRARRPEFPADVTYERSGDTLRISIRGASGLGTIREVTADLSLVPDAAAR